MSENKTRIMNVLLKKYEKLLLIKYKQIHIDKKVKYLICFKQIQISSSMITLYDLYLYEKGEKYHYAI